MADKFDALESARGRSMDAALAAFKEHLEEIVRRATAAVTGTLQRRLSVTDGAIDATPANNRVLRSLDALFLKQLDEGGYPRLVEAFVKQFPEQLVFMRDEIHLLHEMVSEIPAQVKFGSSDLAALSSFQLNAIQALESSAEGAGGVAMRELALVSGSLKFGDLAASVAEKFANSIPRAVGLGDTAMATFYRIAQGRVYDQLAKDMPDREQRFIYAGPDDIKTRPFCERLLQSGKAYLRAEIDEMDNGQMPNVWLSCGGFNCRHRWRIFFDVLSARKAA